MATVDSSDKALWYTFSEAEKVEKVYSQYTIAQFWDWWADGQARVMEVRIKDFELLKQVATHLQYPFSPSGIYVSTADQLKRVLALVRDKAVIWFGLNPRKKNWHPKYGYKTFAGFDTNVSDIAFFVVDIDRVVKEGAATPEQLEATERLANYILEKLALQQWNKGYCKLSSGNGVQLLIKLDFPIRIPDQEFDAKQNMFLANAEYEKIKEIIRMGIGKDILTFCKQYKEELGVEVDKACFNLSRVVALPFSKNYKYDGFTWRGIIDLKEQRNDGLTDHIMSKQEDIALYKSKNVFGQSSSLLQRDRIKPGKLADNILVRFMLDNELPYGSINNKIWFQLKCLLRDSKVDLTTDEFKAIHKELERKYKGTFTLNLPDKQFKFDENIINSYCIEYMIDPLYPLWPKKTKKRDIMVTIFELDEFNIALINKREAHIFPPETTLIEDLSYCRDRIVLKRNNDEHIDSCIKGLIEKYGIERVKYYLKKTTSGHSVFFKFILYD